MSERQKKFPNSTVTRLAAPAPRRVVPEDPELEESPFDDGDEDDQKLDEFRENFGGKQYYVRVERLNDESNEMEIIDKVYLDTFDPFILAKKFGGGKFVCSLLNDSGKYVKGGRMRFTFAKTALPAEAPKQQPDPMQNPALLLLIEQMKGQTAMLADLLSKSLGSPKETDIDKLLGGLKTLQDLNPREKEATPMKQFMEFLTLQKQLKEMSGETEEKGPGLMSEITEALKLLTATRGLPRPRSGAALPNKTISGMPVVTAPNPAPANAAAEVIMPTPSPAVGKLLFYLPKFEEAASNQADPEKWASFLIDIMENEVVPALVLQYHNFVNTDGVWERLIEAAGNEEKLNTIFHTAPSLEPHRTWVLNVVSAAVKQVSDAEQQPEPAPTPNGVL